jgi:hypothetical protein
MPKSPKPPRPDFPSMLEAVERVTPRFGVTLAHEAVTWPLNSIPTTARVRQRIVDAWEALPPDRR